MIDADSRYAVSTHVTAACVVCSSCCTVVSTGITSDCSSANAADARREHRERHLVMRPLATDGHGDLPQAEPSFRFPEPSKPEYRFRHWGGGPMAPCDGGGPPLQD